MLVPPDVPTNPKAETRRELTRTLRVHPESQSCLYDLGIDVDRVGTLYYIENALERSMMMEKEEIAAAHEHE